MSWYAKDALKVEVQFDGTNWTDVSAYVDTSRTMQINRGRDDETGDPLSPGTWSVVLVNDDGRFSPELAASPYYPYVVEDVAIRLSMLANGTYYKRFYGTVQSWSVELLSALANESRCTVTVTDVFGAFPQYEFRQALDEMARRYPPLLYYFPMRGTDAPISSLIGDATMTSNGGDGLGAGVSSLLPLEEGTDEHPKFTAGSGGLTLTVAGLPRIDIWHILLPIQSAPTASVDLIKISDKDTVSWSSSAGFYLKSIGTGTATGLPASWPVILDVWFLSNTDMHVRYWDAPGSYYDTGALFTPIVNLSKIVLGPNLTGGAVWTAGPLLVFGSNTAPGVSAEAFASLMFGTRIPDSVTVASQLSTWADGPTISGGAVGDAVIPPIEGREASDALQSLAVGMGARVADNLDGTLTWVDFPPSGTPITLPAYRVEPSVTWETSDVGWYSDVTVTWPDGTSYTATRTDGRRASLSIEGVHASRSQDRSMADWLVNSPMKARLSKLSFDLATLPAAEQETLVGIKVGDRVEITSLPSAIMPASEILIVEGIEEQIGDGVWTITLTTSPDVYSRLFILDDPVQGVLDAGYLLAP